MAIADDVKFLDAWADDAPKEARVFAAALQRKYPNMDREDALLQFAIDAPEKYRNLVQTLEARYTVTDRQVAERIGRQVIAQQRNGS